MAATLVAPSAFAVLIEERMSSSEPPPEPTSTEPEIGPKTVPQGHHPNSRKNLRRGGPGRPQGSRSRFSKEAIQNFVNQYRADLADDWARHGDAFVAKCREFFPQIYATMQRMRIEDELSRTAADAGPITISWATQPTAPPPSAPEPPRQLEYRKPEMPADLEPEDWQKILSILEVVRRVAPSDAVPGEVLTVVRQALLDHYAKQAQEK
jgi:hypothetical protein